MERESEVWAGAGAGAWVLNSVFLESVLTKENVYCTYKSLWD